MSKVFEWDDGSCELKQSVEGILRIAVEVVHDILDRRPRRRPEEPAGCRPPFNLAGSHAA